MLRLTLNQRISMTIALLVGVFLEVCSFTAYAVIGIQKQANQTVDSDLVQLVCLAGIQYHMVGVRRSEKDISIDLLMKMERVPAQISQWKQHASDATGLLNAAIQAESDPVQQKLLKDALFRQAIYTTALDGTLQKIERQEILDQAIFEMEIEKPVLAALAVQELIAKAIGHNRQLMTQGPCASIRRSTICRGRWIWGRCLLSPVATSI